MSILKRQREVKKNEKAAHKRAKRHGLPEAPMMEPRPTVGFGSSEEDPEFQGDSETETTGEETAEETPERAPESA